MAQIAVGSQNIAGRFADIYSELYNKHSSDHELDDIEVDIANKIKDIKSSIPINDTPSISDCIDFSGKSRY